MTQSLASTSQVHAPLMHPWGLREMLQLQYQFVASQFFHCNSMSSTASIQGYDCLLVRVCSPVGIVPRTRHICLATNQSQVHRRLPWLCGSRKQRTLRLVAKFHHPLVATCAVHQVGHVQKDVIVVQLLPVSLRASPADTIASSLLLGHSSL